MTTTRLTCRLKACGRAELFDTVRQAAASDWTEICPLGAFVAVAPGETAAEHRAYCPGHSL